MSTHNYAYNARTRPMTNQGTPIWSGFNLGGFNSYLNQAGTDLKNGIRGVFGMEQLPAANNPNAFSPIAPTDPNMAPSFMDFSKMPSASNATPATAAPAFSPIAPIGAPVNASAAPVTNTAPVATPVAPVNAPSTSLGWSDNMSSQNPADLNNTSRTFNPIAPTPNAYDNSTMTDFMSNQPTPNAGGESSLWQDIGGWEGVQAGINTATGLFQAYQGFQALDLAKDQFQFSKDAWTQNFNMQKDAYDREVTRMEGVNKALQGG